MSTELSLVAKVLSVHAALGQVPHAFGGALALAYYAEARATIDIDLNVFVPVRDAGSVLGPLATIGVEPPRDVDEILTRDGQVRAWWGRTPLDLFFAYDAFHDAAARARRVVPFADAEIEVLSADHLAVCKAAFSRPKDWVDLDAMLAEGTHLDVAEVLRWLGRIVGDEDSRYVRMGALLGR
ncbi:MAG: hypothetical protein WKF50_13435 [Nocardioides sp.]